LHADATYTEDELVDGLPGVTRSWLQRNAKPLFMGRKRVYLGRYVQEAQRPAWKRDVIPFPSSVEGATGKPGSTSKGKAGIRGASRRASRSDQIHVSLNERLRPLLNGEQPISLEKHRSKRATKIP